jgi:L-threonylcarbamoyladenylate synthase
VDLVIVNDRTDEVIDVAAEGVNPSNTIVDLTFDRPYLVRDGAYPPAQLIPRIPDLEFDTEQYKVALADRLRTANA